MDWLEVLNVKQALINCHIDMRGDWYRDPWGWPELDWVVAKRPDLITARLNGTGVKMVEPIPVPKEGFSTRPAIVFDPLDRLVYEALVDRASIRLLGDLRTWVFGWRLPRNNPVAGHYRDNGQEWDAHRIRLSTLAGVFNCGLQTDIVSFFASIPIERLAEDARSRAGGEVGRRLEDMLVGWSRVPGRPGLPQRSLASAVLANMYLGPLDTVIEGFAFKPVFLRPYGSAVRWMDDIWLFGRDAGKLRRAQLSIEATIRELGLNMNSAKTDVVEGDDLVRTVREIEHSAVDQGLAEEPVNLAPLGDLMERLLVKPEAASRTSIRFLTTRIRKEELWDRVEGFVEAAPRMPHAADHAARLFRDSQGWRDLGDWYVEHAGSAWGALRWSVAQLGTMFPSNEKVPGTVSMFLAEQIPAHPPLVLCALAAQRLAAWDPDVARQAIRESLRSAHHPLERRALALAALAAGEDRHYIRGVLREFTENEVTLLMLEDRRFRPVRLSADFAG